MTQTGQNIAEHRKSAGLTQYELAVALHVSRDLVAKWESGNRLPEYGMIEAMSVLFGTDPDNLISKDALLMADLTAVLPEGAEADPGALKQVLNGFLSSINQRDAGVFVRRYYFLESPGQIGAMYGIRENYVRTVLMRLRRKLKKYLEVHLK